MVMLTWYSVMELKVYANDVLDEYATVKWFKDLCFSYHEPRLRNQGSWDKCLCNWCAMVMLLD
jgi:hypothetical protein